MVHFKSEGSITRFVASVDGVTRFMVEEIQDFNGGWKVLTLDGIIIDTFATLCEVETYIEEMDK